jgi:uncharacterized membrane protein
MSDEHPPEAAEASSDRPLLVVLAVCCAGPMVAIVVLVAVLGVAIGPALAISLGLVAAGLCVALMVGHHRG